MGGGGWNDRRVKRKADMLVICGMQAEASEEILGTGKKTLRLGRTYSGGQSSDSRVEKRVRTDGRW